jgi:hypothetical protein
MMSRVSADPFRSQIGGLAKTLLVRKTLFVQETASEPSNFGPFGREGDYESYTAKN